MTRHPSSRSPSFDPLYYPTCLSVGYDSRLLIPGRFQTRPSTEFSLIPKRLIQTLSRTIPAFTWSSLAKIFFFFIFHVCSSLSRICPKIGYIFSGSTACAYWEGPCLSVEAGLCHRSMTDRYHLFCLRGKGKVIFLGWKKGNGGGELFFVRIRKTFGGAAWLGLWPGYFGHIGGIRLWISFRSFQHHPSSSTSQGLPPALPLTPLKNLI